MAYAIIVDERVRMHGDRATLTDAIEKHEQFAAGYDADLARIRKNERQMARFERKTGPSQAAPPIRGRRTGKPPPPGTKA